MQRLPVILLTAALCTLACAHTSVVPRSEYDHPGHALSYRIYTSDDCTYYVSSYHVTDSTLVVDRLRDLPEDADLSKCGEGRTAPFSLPLSDVQMIEKIRESDEFPLAMFLVFLVVLAVTTVSISYGN